VNSSFKCPACEKPLSWGITMDKGVSSHHLWCGYGPCLSRVCGDGDDGATELEAFKNLDAAFDRELEKHPKGYE